MSAPRIFCSASYRMAFMSDLKSSSGKIGGTQREYGVRSPPKFILWILNSSFKFLLEFYSRILNFTLFLQISHHWKTFLHSPFIWPCTPYIFNSLHEITLGESNFPLDLEKAVSRVGKGWTKVCKYGQKSPWVPTLTEFFPKLQADDASWLGTKNALYYCAQSAKSLSWVLFVSLYTTAVVLVRACLAHAPRKCTQSGDFQFDIKSPADFKILSARKLKTLFQKYKLKLTTGIHACIGHVLR